MAEEAKPTAGMSFTMGDVGAGAQVAQGIDIRMSGHINAADAASLQSQFEHLLSRIAAAPDLDDDARANADELAKKVAAGLSEAPKDPGPLRRALNQAKTFCTGAAAWVGAELGAILKSEAAQKTLGTVTEAATKAAIASFTG